MTGERRRAVVHPHHRADLTMGGHDYSGIRVVVVAHGPPVKGGIATVALDLVEDPGLNAEFEMLFLNTAQNDSQRGEFALSNVKRAFADALGTFRLARRGTVVHTHSVQYPWLVGWRQVSIALGRPAARRPGASAQPRPAAVHGAPGRVSGQPHEPMGVRGAGPPGRRQHPHRPGRGAEHPPVHAHHRPAGDRELGRRRRRGARPRPTTTRRSSCSSARSSSARES